MFETILNYERESIFKKQHHGLLANSQYPEGPALTGHIDTGFSGFPV
jgi:hypothetical protein